MIEVEPYCGLSHFCIKDFINSRKLINIHSNLINYTKSCKPKFSKKCYVYNIFTINFKVVGCYLLLLVGKKEILVVDLN